MTFTVQALQDFMDGEGTRRTRGEVWRVPFPLAYDWVMQGLVRIRETLDEGAPERMTEVPDESA